MIVDQNKSFKNDIVASLENDEEMLRQAPGTRVSLPHVGSDIMLRQNTQHEEEDGTAEIDVISDLDALYGDFSARRSQKVFDDDNDLQIKGSFAPNPDKMQRIQAEDLRRCERRNA